MTVQTSTNVASFNGNGVTQIFPIGFKFNNDTDLVVMLVDNATGAASRLTLNSDYTVSGESDEEGGLINVTVAPAVGKLLKVTRVVDLLQLTDLRNQGKFYAEVHEEVFDKLVMIDQQQQTEIDQAVADSEAAKLAGEYAAHRSDQNLIDMQEQYKEFEQGASFVVIGNYAAGLVIDSYNKIFRKDGEFYRASASLNLPYTLSGNWASESEIFVSVGEGLLRQDLSKNTGSGLIGHGDGTVGDELDRAEARASYREATITDGVVSLNVSQSGAFGIELSESVTEMLLEGALAGRRSQVNIYFKQRDDAGGRTVAFPNSVRMPVSSEPLVVSMKRGETTMVCLATVDAGTTWTLEAAQVYADLGMNDLPALVDENFLLNDEGESTAGWAATSAALSSEASWLRVTKGASGSGVVATKQLSTAVNQDNDFILYGKVRMSQTADHVGVMWLKSATSPYMFSLWLNSAAATADYTAGAVSLQASSGGTLTSAQVIGAAFTPTTPIEVALQYDSKFKTVTCWLRQADGRWKLGARLACTFKQIDAVEFTFTSTAPAGAWIECDYVSLCKPNLVVMGDSIAEGKTLHSPDLSLGLSNDESTWMRHAPIYQGLRNNLIVNKGVGSNTSAMILARVADVTATGAKVVFLHASTNDAGAPVPQSTRTTNIQNTINAIKAAGAEVVLLNAMYGTAAEAGAGWRDYYKQWWDVYRPEISGAAAYIDIMHPMIDANGFMSTSLTQADNIHPNIAGHTAIGSYIKSFE